MYIFMKLFSRQIYSYNFHISKLNNLKVIDDLYSQCLTQTLSKTTFKSYIEGVVKYLKFDLHYAFMQQHVYVCSFLSCINSPDLLCARARFFIRVYSLCHVT